MIGVRDIWQGAAIESRADPQPYQAFATRDAEEARGHRVGRRNRHGAAGGSVNRNTAAATTQVQSPPRTPSVAAVIDWL